MSKIQQKIKTIEEEKVGASSKRVLLVEGIDDVHAITSFLNKTYPKWEKHWVVSEAGNKGMVLQMLSERPNWLGVVDRDEWIQKVIEEKQRQFQNLWVLPRFCIENYLIVPNELWAAFPTNQQEKIAGGMTVLETKLLNNLGQWVAHGVLWSVINPLWEGLRSKGFKEALLAPDVALNEEKIKATLQEWHDYLEPEKLWNIFQTRHVEVKKLSTEEQLKQWVHGKKFYAHVVNPALNSVLGTKSADDRKKAIFRTSPVPDDLNELWEKMGFNDE